MNAGVSVVKTGTDKVGITKKVTKQKSFNISKTKEESKVSEKPSGAG